MSTTRTHISRPEQTRSSLSLPVPELRAKSRDPSLFKVAPVIDDDDVPMHLVFGDVE
ncbi:unnamed protein product [Periconia digitata]|uniref:Uncharacterized protein n=1 Tax=Periconia digitata TaxID=1303443 RepID=A0A9W4UH09_9PLEO|nr:unnamed protein product [Periconia digitata]